MRIQAKGQISPDPFHLVTAHIKSVAKIQTKLSLQILVTSLFDTTVEIEFEHLFEWQIKDSTYIYGACVDLHGCIVWSSDIYSNTDELKSNSYVIAKFMKWRIVNESIS